MRIWTILAGAALAFALTAGSASAADTFKVLYGIDAVPLAAAEMEAVRGMFAIDANIAARGNGTLQQFTPDSVPNLLVDVDVTVSSVNPPVVGVSGNND